MNLEEAQTQESVPEQEQQSPIEVVDNLEDETFTSEEVSAETLVQTPQEEPAEATTDDVIATEIEVAMPLVTDETAEFTTIAAEIEEVTALVTNETAEATTAENFEAVTALA